MKIVNFCALTAFFAGRISASVIFQAGNNPQTDENVLYHSSCSFCVDGPANTVVGHTQNSNVPVDLTSEETLQVVGPGFNAVSGLSSTVGFDDMAISLPGYTFTSIIFQLTSLSSAPDGLVWFTAKTVADGNVSSPSFAISHTGGNYFTITVTATGNTLFTEMDLLTNVWQDNISQLRIGGVTAGGGVQAIPEPATYGMVGLALVGLGLVRRRLTR